MSEMFQRYFLHLSFNGKNYSGWQIQKNGRSIQSELNHALSTLLGEVINVVGCGRTDAGVHAENFYAHFDSASQTLLNDRIDFTRKMNSFLPRDIAVFKLLKVIPKANARFNALSRTYEYRISREKNPFLEEYSLLFHGELQVKLMNEGARTIMNYSDFTSFSKLHTQVATNNCIIHQSHWKEDHQLLIFSITADRFLRNMVRAIVGTLLDVGKQKIGLDELKTIIESKNRSNAGMSVPAKGLFLVRVDYPDHIFI
jgi:tRNA pseudouridine38-40 synthase